MHLFAPWASFYEVTGSAAAALTGLVFVVITLITSSRVNVTSEGVAAFTTPIIVHFASTLCISLLLCAPWTFLLPLRIMLMFIGAAGLWYSIRLALLNRRLSVYRLDMDDWIFHVVLPGISYAALFSGGLFLRSAAECAAFCIAGAAVSLILLGIRNAWDVVTFLAIEHVNAKPETASAAASTEQ